MNAVLPAGPPLVVAFDAFGTLFDTGERSVLATRTIFARYGREEEAPALYARWKAIHRARSRARPFVKEVEIFRLGLGDLFEELGIPRGNAERDVAIMLDTLDQRKAYPDVREALAYVGAKYRVVIASNSDEEPLSRNIERNDIVVERHFSSETLRIYKPASEFYSRFAAELRVSLHCILYIGDSPEEDIRGPKSAGMAVAWLNRRAARLDESIPDPDHRLRTLEELRAFL